VGRKVGERKWLALGPAKKDICVNYHRAQLRIISIMRDNLLWQEPKSASY
jgi:hypothetical protein